MLIKKIILKLFLKKIYWFLINLIHLIIIKIIYFLSVIIIQETYNYLIFNYLLTIKIIILYFYYFLLLTIYS